MDARLPNEDLPARHAIAALAAHASDPAAALRVILREISRALAAESCCIALLNPDTGRLEIEAEHGLPPAARTQPIDLGQGIPGWVALHGRPLLVPDVTRDTRYRALRDQVGCQMAAPLLAGTQVLGVVMADQNAPGAYGEAHLQRLVALTAEAAAVLRRLWLLEHLQGKARQLEALLGTGQSLVSKLEIQELMDTLTRDTRHMLGCQASVLYLHDAAAETLRCASLSPATPGLAPEGELPLGSCLAAATINTRRQAEFADIQSPGFAGVADIPRSGELRSVLTTPIQWEGEVLGVLAVFTNRLHRFTDDEKRLCSAIAGLGAVALQNARLYTRVFQGEETLRKNEQLTTLGLLAAEIAHEIRNPLTVLKLLHGQLGLEFAEDDPRRTDVRVISEKLDQLESTVSRVLQFAKAPEGLHSRWSFADIIGDTLALLRLKLAQAKVQLEFHPPPPPFFITVNKGQIQQVLLNLLLNAMQAMPDGGLITLTLSPVQQEGAPCVRLDIADSGAGIPAEIRDRIFDSFLSGRPGGTGLGLAIARRVMLSHHGDITVAATGPAGTTMRLVLPLAKA